jgi:hypothetical protein
MCSTTAARIARICGAIEELAGRIDEVPHGGPSAEDHDVAERLAALWAMIADLDPELAKRLPGYLTATDSAPGS